jgi:hypothetical protein
MLLLRDHVCSLHTSHVSTVVFIMAALSDRRSLPTFVAGGVAGCTAAVLTCPLEVIKTKLQSRNLARASFLNVVRSTWRTEGYKGFFRGLGPLLSGEGAAADAALVLRNSFLQGFFPDVLCIFLFTRSAKNTPPTLP